jgi:U3 small nucleolar RNA-associated protein 3
VSESDDDDGRDEVAEPDDVTEDNISQTPGRSAKKVRPKTMKTIPKHKSKTTDSTSSEEPSDDDTWGRKKSAYYSSNAPEIASDDEDAKELEEQEANRLQRKSRALMLDSDFGLGDPVQFETEEEPSE